MQRPTSLLLGFFHFALKDRFSLTTCRHGGTVDTYPASDCSPNPTDIQARVSRNTLYETEHIEFIVFLSDNCRYIHQNLHPTRVYYLLPYSCSTG